MTKKTPPREEQPVMEREWEIVSNKLRERAFRMWNKVGDIFTKLYGRAATTPDACETKPILRLTYSWLLAPLTLWPIDFDGLSRFVYSHIKRKKPLDPALKFLLHLVKDVPSEREQQVIGDYEHIVQQGAYDQLLRDDAKYIARLKELLDNPEFHADLARLKELFDLTKFESPDSKRILRRTLVCERNMRLAFLFLWAKERERFQQIFDCFCWKYHLYGLEAGEKPLLMKLTVNPTPHGLMIFVPVWMSFDLWRDLLHTKVTELIRARGVKRQGPKFSEARMKTQELGVRTYLASLECDASLTGEEQLKKIIEIAGLPPRTSSRQMRRYRGVGEAIMNSEKTNPTARPRTTDAEAIALNAAKLSQAKAAFAALSTEDKDAFQKWQAERLEAQS